MRLPYLGAAVVRDVLLLLLTVSQFGAAVAADDPSDLPTPSPLWIQPSGEWCVILPLVWPAHVTLRTSAD
jgi:hypothetical protein